DQQQVHRQGFAVAEQLVAALAPAQAAGRQQRARGLGQPTALLDGDAQTLARRGGQGGTHGKTQWEAEAVAACWRWTAAAYPPAPRSSVRATRPMVVTLTWVRS